MEYTLADLARITGAKRRSVQVWAEAGALRADSGTERKGTGTHRRFSRDETMIACVLSAFAGMQVPIGQLIVLGDHFRTLLKKAEVHAAFDEAIEDTATVYVIVQDLADHFKTNIVRRAFNLSDLADAEVDRDIGKIVTQFLGNPNAESIVLMLNVYLRGMSVSHLSARPYNAVGAKQGSRVGVSFNGYQNGGNA